MSLAQKLRGSVAAGLMGTVLAGSGCTIKDSYHQIEDRTIRLERERREELTGDHNLSFEDVNANVSESNPYEADINASVGMRSEKATLRRSPDADIREEVEYEDRAKIPAGEVIFMSLIGYPLQNVLFGIPLIHDTLVFPVKSLEKGSFQEGFKSTIYYKNMEPEEEDWKTYEMSRIEIGRSVDKGTWRRIGTDWIDNMDYDIPVEVSSSDFEIVGRDEEETNDDGEVGFRVRSEGSFDREKVIGDEEKRLKELYRLNEVVSSGYWDGNIEVDKESGEITLRTRANRAYPSEDFSEARDSYYLDHFYAVSPDRDINRSIRNGLEEHLDSLFEPESFTIKISDADTLDLINGKLKFKLKDREFDSQRIENERIEFLRPYIKDDSLFDNFRVNPDEYLEGPPKEILRNDGKFSFDVTVPSEYRMRVIGRGRGLDYYGAIGTVYFEKGGEIIFEPRVKEGDNLWARTENGDYDTRKITGKKGHMEVGLYRMEKKTSVKKEEDGYKTIGID